MGLSTHHQR